MAVARTPAFPAPTHTVTYFPSCRCRGMKICATSTVVTSVRTKPLTLTYLEGNSWLWDVTGIRIVVDPILVGNLDFGVPWLFDGAKKTLKNFQLKDLQELDCLLITQSLDDHCHKKTLEPLSKIYQDLRVISTPNAEPILETLFKEVTYIEPGQSTQLKGKNSSKITIRASAGPVLGPPWQRPENGYFIEAQDPNFTLYYEPHCVYNKSLLEKEYADVVITPVIKQLLPAFTLVSGQEDAVELARLLKARYVVPMNNGELETKGLLSNIIYADGTLESFKVSAYPLVAPLWGSGCYRICMQFCNNTHFSSLLTLFSLNMLFYLHYLHFRSTFVVVLISSSSIRLCVDLFVGALCVRKMGCNKSKIDFRFRKFKKPSNPSNLELKMVEVMKKRAASRDCSLKSFNSVIMKFHKIDESFTKLRSVFQKIDEDSNETIDLDELKCGFQELHVSFTDKEIKELYQECDMNESKGIDFKEFILLLALVYLLEDSSAKSILLPELEASFKTIVDTFVFFDKDSDGYVTKNEMVQAINDVNSGQRAAGHDIGLKRFEEMDWNKDGSISFKEFLFAFTNWVGVEDGNDDS